MTFYQKVKKALAAHGPISYARLAEEMGWDIEATRLTIVELSRRGKLEHDGDPMYERRLWKLRTSTPQQ